ncbi:MAG: iron-sulfur cluster assembly accessory protein [Gammaproteobacteria bacterium]|nr:iron-sulfur cluster assembly accessory protein [Gammaproteobacteria bacterium]
MSISLTQAAAQRIQSMLEERGSGIGIRLGVKKNGCAGFAYVLDFADEQSENDSIFTQHDASVIVDEDSLQILEGIELDYVTEGLNKSFKFRNPNVTDMCGCGESFSVS